MSRRNRSRPRGTQVNTTGVSEAVSVMDAFSNPLFRLGHGSQSPLEATEYPMTRMTGHYALLNSLYRENWVVQNVVGLVVDDMLREWYKVKCNLSQGQLDELRKAERQTNLRERINEGLRWGRLYGGAAGLILIKGQEGMLEEPLDLETVMPESFAGLYILDRWCGVTPGAELVLDLNDPDFNLPAYYTINDAQGRRAAKVHHSRVIRFTGRELPYLERIAELYWGESEVESLYKDVVAHDNVSANMAALTFRANINTMEVQNLDQLFSLASGEAQRRFWNVMQAQSVMMSNFGYQLVNKGDQMTNTQYSFGGLQEVYESMCLNLCGASHYPMTKLFGRSPAGMNATGESDLQNYYDYVDGLRESKLRPALQKLLPILATSVWGMVPEDLDIIFPPLWKPTAREAADITKVKTETIISVFQAGLIGMDVAQKELKKLADETGMFEGISDEEIAANAGKTYQDATQTGDASTGLGLDGEKSGSIEGARDGLTTDYNSNHDPENGQFANGGGDGYDKPTGFAKNKKGEKTLDETERERYNKIIIGIKASNGVTIKKLSEHAYDRAAQRGIAPSQILDALQSAPTISSKDPTCREYDNKGIRVVVNYQSGNIVSVMKRRGAT